jgi:geranylgeranyl pyrophosphate synthase
VTEAARRFSDPRLGEELRPAPAGSGMPPWLTGDMARIERLLLERAGGSPHPLVSEASTHLIRAGGKRLRPALVLLSSHMGRSRTKASDLAAAALELVHLASLYHDDVLDETDTRRGAPTVHSKWGTEVAILAGDYLFASGCAMGAEAGGEVPGILARSIVDVCEGQIMETASVGDARRQHDSYVATIERKTGSLFRAACELGCATAAAPPARRARLEHFGEHLGLTFQIVDDLLDLVGDPEVTGKQPGTDLREGVFTLPVILGRDSDRALAGVLISGERRLDAILPRLRSNGALDEAWRRAEAAGQAAVDCIEGLGTAEWRDAMAGVVGTVLAQLDATTLMDY